MEFLSELDSAAEKKLTMWRPIGKAWSPSAKGFCEWMIKAISDSGTQTETIATELSPAVKDDLQSTLRYNCGAIPKSFFCVLSRFLQSDIALLSCMDSCCSQKISLESASHVHAPRVRNGIESLAKFASESAADLLGIPAARGEVAVWVATAILSPRFDNFVSAWTRSAKLFPKRRSTSSQSTQMFPITLVHSSLVLADTDG